jgi:hypothetical protein
MSAHLGIRKHLLMFHLQLHKIFQMSFHGILPHLVKHVKPDPAAFQVGTKYLSARVHPWQS